MNSNLSPLKYNSIVQMLYRTAKMAGVKKRVNPHNFRHSRETYLANFLTEAKMAGVYVHMSGRNVDNALLKIYGIKNDEEKRESIFKPKECPRCQKVNQATNKFCSRCGMKKRRQRLSGSPWIGRRRTTSWTYC